MSVQAMAWAIDQQVVTDPSARHVLLCLCNYADVNWESMFPSVERLCRDTGLSERSVRYKLDELEKSGVIQRFGQNVADVKIGRRDRTPTCYKLRGANLAPRESTGCKPRRHGVQNTSLRGAAVAPNPLFNRQVTGALHAQKCSECSHDAERQFIGKPYCKLHFVQAREKVKQ